MKNTNKAELRLTGLVDKESCAMLTDAGIGEFPSLDIEEEDNSVAFSGLRGSDPGPQVPEPGKPAEIKETKLVKKAIEDVAIELMVDKDVMLEATDFSNGLCVMIGRASSTITKLAAMGLGSDVSARIKSHCTSCENHYRNIKKLVQAEDCAHASYVTQLHRFSDNGVSDEAYWIGQTMISIMY